MALQKQTVPVSLRGGLDTRSAPKTVIPGKLLVAENIQFDNPGAYQTRNGYAALGSNIVGGAGSVTTGQALATLNNELVLCDQTSLYSYDAGNAGFVNKGGLASATVTMAPVVRNTNNQAAQDGATHPLGLQCYAWEDSGGGVRYSVIDQQTGQQIVANAVVNANGGKPKVVALATGFVIWYYNTSDNLLYAALVPVGNPTAALAPVAQTSTAGNGKLTLKTTAPNYDVTTNPGGTLMYMAFNSDAASGGTTVFVYSSNHPTVRTNEADLTGAATVASQVINLAYNTGAPTGYCVILTWYDGNYLRFNEWNAGLTAGTASQIVEHVANVVAVTCCANPQPSTVNYYSRYWYYTISTGGTDTYNYKVRTNYAIGSTIHSATDFLLSVGVAGKAFLYGGVIYVPLARQSESAGGAQGLQNTYFLASQSGTIIAKVLYSNGGGLPSTTVQSNPGSYILPEVTPVAGSTTAFRIAWQAQDSLAVANAGTATVGTYANTGVNAVTLDFFNGVNSYSRAQLANNMHFGGGFVSMYDGISPVEHGFHIWPEYVSAALTNGSNNLSAGQYQGVVVYEWADGQGQIHRSAPSIPITFTAASGDKAVWTIETLRLTAKQGARTAVQCALYRTIANGTVFYRVGSKANTTTANTVTFTDDTVTDAVLVGNALLYTTGGVLADIAPNPSAALVSHVNRLFLVDTTDPLQIWYSKQVQAQNAPVEFAAELVMNADPKGGNVTALGSLDDKLIVFKGDRIFFVSGQGPDATGGQSDFSPMTLVSSDCGCTNERSVVLVPEGLIFQSAKGIYLLGRDLSVKYIGADVQAYNGETVTSGALIPNTRQIRLTLAASATLPEPAALMFDYAVGQWATHTNINAVDSTIWGGQFCYLTPGGVVMHETPGVYSDNGSFISARIVTAPLSLAGIQGSERVWEVLLLGDYLSDHQLTVQCAFDFNPTFTQSVTFTPSSIIKPSTWGSGPPSAPYGDPYGGAYVPYQWRIQPAQERTQTIQISIQTAQAGATIGPSMSLSSIALMLGVRSGLREMPAASTFG